VNPSACGTGNASLRAPNAHNLEDANAPLPRAERSRR
jgi:hypothetical protein